LRLLSLSLGIDLNVSSFKFFSYQFLSAHSASVYLTLAVTIERYVAICHPFKARTNFTWRQATYIVIGIFMGSFIYNLPKWWEFVAIGILDGNNVVVRYVPVTTSLRRNPIYEKYYCYSAYMVLIYSLPLLILILFNVLIYKAVSQNWYSFQHLINGEEEASFQKPRFNFLLIFSKVKRANVQRRMLSSSEQSENQIARMLVMVVLVFILCNAMTLVNIAAKIISGSPTITGVDSLRNFSVVLNSCINFVIYCAYGEKFREIFKQMWPLWIQKLCCKTYCNRQRYSQSSRSSKYMQEVGWVSSMKISRSGCNNRNSSPCLLFRFIG